MLKKKRHDIVTVTTSVVICILNSISVEIFDVSFPFQICLDMLLCLKTHKSMSQEAPLENDTRDFVSRILKNVEDEWVSIFILLAQMAKGQRDLSAVDEK